MEGQKSLITEEDPKGKLFAGEDISRSMSDLLRMTREIYQN
jgi:hypothetical protein